MESSFEKTTKQIEGVKGIRHRHKSNIEGEVRERRKKGGGWKSAIVLGCHTKKKESYRDGCEIGTRSRTRNST